jgi:hypothetical protein
VFPGVKPSLFIYKFYTLRPAVVLYFCHSGLSGIFLAIPNKSEGFPTSGNDTENKYSISDTLQSLPQGFSRSKKNGLCKGLTNTHTFITDITDPAFTGINENVYHDKNDDTIFLL